MVPVSPGGAKCKLPLPGPGLEEPPLSSPLLPDAISEKQLIVCIKSGNRPDVEDIIEQCPWQIISLMKKCWAPDPGLRPSFNGKSPFAPAGGGGRSLVKRGTSLETRQH